jgi:hypothetical protein
MPVTIKATARGWYEGSTSVYWTARSVWDTGTALYAVVQDTGASPKVRVLKADSRTAPTAFTEQDSANAKTVGAATSPFSSWYSSADGYIYVAHTSASANVIVLSRFNTSGDTWQSAAVATSGTVASIERPWRVVVRTNGDWYVFFTSSADDADLGFYRSIGGSISTGASNILAVNSTAASHYIDAGLDSTGIIWVAAYDTAAADMKYTTILTDNTFPALVVVDSANTGAETAVMSGGRFDLFDDAGTDKIVYAYITTTPNVVERVVSMEASAATGRLAAAVNIHTTAANVGDRTPVSTARVGTTDYAAWWDDASSGTIYYSTKTAGSWAAATSWKTGVSRVIEIIPVSTGLLGVYQSDATTVVVDWIVMAVDTTAIASTITGTSTVTADINAAATLSSTITGTSAVTANAGASAPLATTITGASSLVADITTLYPLASAITGASTVTGDAASAQSLISAMSGASTVTAGMDASATLSAAVAGSSDVTAALTQSATLATAITGASAVTADVTPSIAVALAATISGSSAGTANIVTAQSLAATIIATSTVTADATEAGATTLAATITGASTITAALSAAATLTTTMTGSGALAGTLAQTTTLQATITGSSAVTVAIISSQAMAATITGASMVTADLIDTSPITGAATFDAADQSRTFAASDQTRIFIAYDQVRTFAAEALDSEFDALALAATFDAGE